MKASHVYCRNFSRGKKDKLQPPSYHPRQTLLSFWTYLSVLFGINVHIHMMVFFLNKNWITLCIFFSNLLFKMCIYILEYVIHIQIQNSKRTQSSIVRSKSPSHPICQHLVSL